jgi:hypothetical protein
MRAIKIHAMIHGHIHGLAVTLALSLAVLTLSAPARAADPVFPPGSRLGLVPPGAMTVSKTFEGFIDAQNNAAILLTALPAEAYAQLEKTGVPDDLRKQGFTIDKSEPIELKAGKGYLITGAEVADKQHYRKWLLVALLDGVTALVSVQAPEQDSTYSDKVLRAALSTIAARPAVPDAERLSLLPFTVGDLAGFRISDVLPGRALMLVDVPADADKDALAANLKARLMISALSGGPSQPSDWANFARVTFGAIGGIRDVHIQISEPLRIGGQPGYQTVARAKDASTGVDIMVVQWLRFGSVSQQMLGISLADAWNDEFPRLRTIRDSVDPR